MFEWTKKVWRALFPKRKQSETISCYYGMPHNLAEVPKSVIVETDGNPPIICMQCGMTLEEIREEANHVES